LEPFGAPEPPLLDQSRDDSLSLAKSQAPPRVGCPPLGERSHAISPRGDGARRVQYLVVNFPLPSILPFPQGYHHLRYNPAKQVLGIETGEGPTHMAPSITALANDRRFDFSHA
jgi:Purine nucleoside permease (NUP)